jgi:energy-coupling factor transport system permease protein
MLGYLPRNSPVHALSPAVKLILFLLWSVLAMAGYDTRVMLVMALGGGVLFGISKIRVRDISFIFKMLFLFMALNLGAIYLFAPEQGCLIYGSRHLLLPGWGRFTITGEELFYLFNILLKYLMVVPAAILLIVTVHPSEFAASLNQIGVPPAAAFAVALTLRYIPDVQRDFETISQAQQARGVELSRKVSLPKRLRGAAAILLPLVISSIERIDVISRAMELRGFGKHRRRTWYCGRPFRRRDILSLVGGILLFALGMWITFKDGNRFWSPFR